MECVELAPAFAKGDRVRPPDTFYRTPGRPLASLSPRVTCPGVTERHCAQRMKKLATAALAAASLIVCAFTITAQDWTRFRGPNGTGISQAKGLPTKISDGNLNWKVELPGSGHSSPVLWGERIFLTSTGDKSGGISVFCLSAKDGRLLWKRDFPLTPFSRHPF